MTFIVNCSSDYSISIPTGLASFGPGWTGRSALLSYFYSGLDLGLDHSQPYGVKCVKWLRHPSSSWTIKVVRRRGSTCYYCGMPGNTRDHVVPTSIVDYVTSDMNLEALQVAIEAKRKIVRCCRQCNSLLSNGLDLTLNDRKIRLKNLLHKKYEQLLLMPDWTQQELDFFGPVLRSVVEGEIAKKAMIEARLAW